MEEMLVQFSSFGAIGIGFAILFKNILEEKKEDRKMYIETVDKFADIVNKQADAYGTINMRVGNIEKDVSYIKDTLTKGE